MEEILSFIKIFHKYADARSLFLDTACYWFAVILKTRFPNNSYIVYNIEKVHFATWINGVVYDITGAVEYPEDYIDWDYYEGSDIGMILSNCINMK